MFRRFANSIFNQHRRNLFIVSLDYKAPLNEVEKHLEAHRKFLEKGYKENIFMTSGRKEPRSGGIIIASIDCKQKLLKTLEQDPFYQNKIATYEITEFLPTLANKEFMPIALQDLKTRIGKP